MCEISFTRGSDFTRNHLSRNLIISNFVTIEQEGGHEKEAEKKEQVEEK